MSIARKILHPIARGVEKALDVKNRLFHGGRGRRGESGPVEIVPYLGYGNRERLHQTGRVLAREAREYREDPTRRRNVLRAIRRFRTDEVPGAVLVARRDGREARVETDHEGYFELEFPAGASPRETARCAEIEYELVRPEREGLPPARATGRVAVPGTAGKLAVVSDIDDTILVTGATDFLDMAKKVLFKSARSRVPFPGVAELYRALARGGGDEPVNPVAYVSSSAWNLYDFFVRFLEMKGLPLGPLFLRDLGISRTKFVKGRHEDHKPKRIEALFRAWPDRTFVLVGDSGQRDAEIYRDLARDHAARIGAVWIRNVSAGSRREREVEEIAAELTERGVPMRLVADSLAAAEHAESRGWIREADVEEVARAIG